MALSEIRQEHVLAAIQECDRLGRERFLADHGFGGARSYFLRYGGKEYDSKAIVGVAHGYATGQELKAADFVGGNQTVRPLLESLGFSVGPRTLEGGKSSQEAQASPRMRNPPWSDEELILALDLYLRDGLLDDRDERVVELSTALNALPIHRERPDATRFRNPNGVALKLANFASLDPSYQGKGMSRGGRRDAEIWRMFAGDEDALAAAAANVRTGHDWHLELAQPQAHAWSATLDPIEAVGSATFEVHRAASTADAQRREQPLVHEFAEHLRSMGHRVARHSYRFAGASMLLRTDLFDETDLVLYEAKADLRRESLRMAVGQLFDYARLEPKQPRLAILLPRRPSDDLLAFLGSVAIACVYREDGGGWAAA